MVMLIRLSFNVWLCRSGVKKDIYIRNNLYFVLYDDILIHNTLKIKIHFEMQSHNPALVT